MAIETSAMTTHRTVRSPASHSASVGAAAGAAATGAVAQEAVHDVRVKGFAPFGLSGVEMAVSAGGIIFAYLGLTPIISVASEVKNPQRTIPIALILSVLLSTAIYALLQLAFLGSIPTEMLANGWAGVTISMKSPER
mgnify:CR=1 FL=1